MIFRSIPKHMGSKSNRGGKWGGKFILRIAKTSIHAGLKLSFNWRQPTTQDTATICKQQGVAVFLCLFAVVRASLFSAIALRNYVRFVHVFCVICFPDFLYETRRYICSSGGAL